MRDSYTYTSKDRLFEVTLHRQVCEMMRELCGKLHPKETGGILIGYYSEDQHTAIITKITGPPGDSKHGLAWFERGTEGLQNILDNAWEKEQVYYLGEWHYHPKDFPSPSSIDINQMELISKNPKYHCPEPILIIVNGDTNKTLCAYVFPSDKSYISLEEF
ncbi:Mov34/MPN/PAD-1 family protein [Oceanobacillus luteolus]|uniref:Mov34/MPN/PAD-1 family protein n=1 Tax=Oceanobacillus luteolus TaxID=1274358 RepID=A0ABW4HPT5_9BACI